MQANLGNVPKKIKEMKNLDRKKDPYLMILFLPYWMIYWLGTAVMAITLFCNDKWTEWETLNNS